MRSSVIGKRKKRFRFKKLVPFLLGLCAIALIVVLIVLLIPNNIPQVKLSKLKKMPCSSSAVFTPFGTGLAFLDTSAGNLYYADEHGDIQWGFSGAAEGMTLTASGSHLAAVYGKKLQVLSLSGNLLFSKEFDSVIKAVSVSDTLTAVRLSGSDSITVLSASGEMLDVLSAATNCSNIRFGLCTDGSRLWVISVENSGYKPKYQLATYQYTPSKVQAVTFESDEQMFYTAQFGANALLVVGTETALNGNYAGSTLSNHTVSGFTWCCGIAVKDQLRGLLLSANGRVRLIGGETDRTLDFDSPILWATMNGKYCYCFSSHYLYRYKISNQNTEKLLLPIKADLVLAGSGYVLFVSGDVIYRYTL